VLTRALIFLIVRQRVINALFFLCILPSVLVMNARFACRCRCRREVSPSWVELDTVDVKWIASYYKFRSQKLQCWDLN